MLAKNRGNVFLVEYNNSSYGTIFNKQSIESKLSGTIVDFLDDLKCNNKNTSKYKFLNKVAEEYKDTGKKKYTKRLINKFLKGDLKKFKDYIQFYASPFELNLNTKKYTN